MEEVKVASFSFITFCPDEGKFIVVTDEVEVMEDGQEYDREVVAKTEQEIMEELELDRLLWKGNRNNI